MADLGNLELKVIVDTASLSEAADKSDEARAAAEELQGAYDKTAKKSASARAATLKYNQTLGQLDDRFRQGKMSLEEYRRSVALLSARFDTITKDVGVAGKTFGRFGSQIQNVGFQVGDFATQVASGQSAVVALAQQLPQLLGGLGVFGALAGAATAIGGALYLYAQDAEEAAKETKEYRKEVDLLRDALVSLNESRRQEAAAAPENLLSNIATQRRALEELIAQLNEVSSGAASIDLVNPFASRSGGSIELQAENYEALEALVKSTAQTITDLTGEEVELNNTYGSRAALLEAVQKLRADALTAVRELGQNEEKLNEDIGEQGDKERKAAEAAKERLAALNQQLAAIQSGTNALDAQQALNRQSLIDSLTAKGIEEETATALVDQEAALKGLVEKEVERVKAAEAASKEAEQQRKQNERALQAEQDRIKAANASAEMQLMALQAEQQALQQGKSARDAAFIAQQKLTAEQLRGKGVAEDIVQEILRLRDELRNAGDDAGDEFAKGFESASAQIAGSVTDALISGDWEGTGQQIGSVMGAAIAGALSAGNPIAMAIGGSVGGSLFGGGGDNYVDPTAARQASQNTGDILGGINDKSQSIADATQQTADTLSELVGVNRELLAAQQGADQSIEAFAAAAASSLSVLQEVEGVRDVGIQFGPDGAEFFASGKGFGKSVAAAAEDIANRLTDLTTPFDSAIDSVGDLLEQSAETLGVELSGVFSKELLDLGRVSLEGLSAEEYSQVISQTFGTALNQASDQLVPDIQRFVDEVGESSGQVLQDFARNATVATGSLSGLNSSLDQLTGLELGQAATDLVEVFGDGSALAAAASGIFGTFASEEQQSAERMARLNAEFSKLGLVLPDAREGVFELVQGLDLTTESGRTAFEAISRSSDALDDYYQELSDGAEEAAQAAEDAFAGLRSATDSALAALKRSIDAQSDAIRDQVGQQLDALKAQEAAALAANRAQIDAAKDRVSLIKDELSDITSAFEDLRGNVSSLVEFDRRSALQTLRNAVSTGDLTGTGAAAEAASQINETRFRSAVDLRREQIRTVNLLDELKGDGETQLTTAEQQLEAAQIQTDAIKSGFDALMNDAQSAADAQLDQLRETYEQEAEAVDALRGIDNTLLTIRDAIEALGVARGNEQASVEDQVRQAYQDILGRVDEGPGGVDFFAASVLAGERTIADVRADLAFAQEQNAIPGFANGGDFGGGLRIVGERGPELEMTGPSRIIPHNAIMGAISGTGVASELKPMLEQAVALLQNINTYAREDNNRLSRWDGQGLPETRDFA